MTVNKKTDTKSDESFLSRWARVKYEGDDGKAESLPINDGDDDATRSAGSLNTESANSSIDRLPRHKVAGDARPERTSPDSSLPTPLPALDSLTAQSDFSPFMAKDVDPQLRNQAMKKLFTDPHYNVMDRLDTYIDDYSIESPLSMDIIRQMSISKTLGLFDDEDKKESVADAQSNAPIVSLPDAVEPPHPAIEAPAKSDADPDVRQQLKHLPD